MNKWITHLSIPLIKLELSIREHSKSFQVSSWYLCKCLHSYLSPWLPGFSVSPVYMFTVCFIPWFSFKHVSCIGLYPFLHLLFSGDGKEGGVNGGDSVWWFRMCLKAVAISRCIHPVFLEQGVCVCARVCTHALRLTLCLMLYSYSYFSSLLGFTSCAVELDGN